ncbi:MAG: hypothetical protein JWO09_677 [Bacteroidetes bacterium]|nr:hypothetical protein [Bacteroidota bacterium]
MIIIAGSAPSSQEGRGVRKRKTISRRKKTHGNNQTISVKSVKSVVKLTVELKIPVLH